MKNAKNGNNTTTPLQKYLKQEKKWSNYSISSIFMSTLNPNENRVSSTSISIYHIIYLYG
jgi:hypothetical protein